MSIIVGTIVFWFFFGCALSLYYIFPSRFKWVCLIGESIIFFLFSSVRYTIIYVLLTAILTFLSTNGIRKCKGKKLEKTWLLIGILGNFMMLAVLKYTSFVIGNIDSVARIIKGIPMLIEIPKWSAPIGISFYTLSAIGYIADCYWGMCEPSGNFLKDLLFICYWPILTSGPIIKYSEISNQLFSEHKFDIDRISFGIQRILWGIIKKIVISARLSVIVDTIYGDTSAYNGFYIWIAAVAFMMQLYTDFSGCMDIILGASECYGIILPENFRTPFFAKSVQEYWQRWHITLGGWYREYILYPLLNTKGLSKIERKYKKRFGRKVGRVVSSCIGMLFVWLLIGLWHGGNWKYVAMGLFFFIIISFETITNEWFVKMWDKMGIPTRSGGWKALQCFRVFMLVTIGNMFFRLQNVKITLATFKLGLKYNPWIFYDDSLYDLGLSRKSIKIMAVSLVVLFIVSLFKRKGDVRTMIARQPLPIRWSIYFALLFVPVIFGIYGPEYDAQAFIYGGF